MKSQPRFIHFKSLLFVLLLFLVSCTSQRSKLPLNNQYEKDIAAFEQLDKKEKYPENALLFVGSSSIRIWSTLKEDIAPYAFIQRGFGGSRTPDVLQYLKRIAYPHRFSALVFFVANDITGSPKDLTPKESLHNFREMVKIIRAKYAKQPIFFIEITPTQSRWKYWPLNQQINSGLKAYCQKGKNLYFIETAQSYLNEKSEPRNELFRNDHLHLNREGYKIWGKLIKAEIDKRLKANS